MPLTISSMARQELGVVLRRSQAHDPVIVFVDSATILASPQLKKAVLDGADQDQVHQLEELAVDAFRYAKEFRLEAATFDRSLCSKDDLRVIDEIPIAMRTEVVEALADYCIDHNESGFFLRSSSETVLSLRMAAPLRGWFRED